MTMSMGTEDNLCGFKPRSFKILSRSFATRTARTIALITTATKFLIFFLKRCPGPDPINEKSSVIYFTLNFDLSEGALLQSRDCSDWLKFQHGVN